MSFPRRRESTATYEWLQDIVDPSLHGDDWEGVLKIIDVLKHIDPTNLRDARLLLANVLNITPEETILNPDLELSQPQLTKFNAMLTRLNALEPVSKILGQRWFWNDLFKVTADTLDPRPETELIIESVLKYFPDKTAPYRILDLGTGTGCLIISLLKEYVNATGLAVDISEPALEVAKENAASLGVTSVEFQHTSWCQGITNTFDIIVSNPPYINTSEQLPDAVKNYDPGLALFAGSDGLDAYREIAASVKKVCKTNTKIFLEIGQGQARQVSELFSQAGFVVNEIAADLSNIQRCLVIAT